MKRSYRSWLFGLVAACLVGGAAWAAFAPLARGSREELFEIPKGTWARRMAGDKVEILPAVIYLTVGVKDILHLKNQDDVPQTFGPVLIMPGQSFKLPFSLASDYQFICTAHASGQMSIIVQPEPTPGLARLQWRARTAFRSGRSILERGWA